MSFRTVASALAVTVGLVGLTACSSDDGGSAADDTTTEDTAAEHNEADVTFAQGMIPHHEQAIEMAQLAGTNAESPDVIDLAGRIEAAQGPEIEELRGWLEDWGEEETMAGMSEDDMGGMDMGGMSEEDMAALESATGAEFDQMFLEMMIEHHRGAIEMAETEVAEGSFPDAVEMARTIASTQEAEIAEMEGLLAELGI